MREARCGAWGHLFLYEPPVPPDEPCVCGEHTWREMDEILMLTRMWETDADRS